MNIEEVDILDETPLLDIELQLSILIVVFASAPEGWMKHRKKRMKKIQ